MIRGTLAAACAAACLAGPALSDDAAQQASDALFDRLAANVAQAPGLETLVEIDHTRLAGELGEVMPPSRVLIFSQPALDAALLQIDPRIGVDLPLRVLAFATPDSAKAQVVFNSAEFIASRYGVSMPDHVRAAYVEAMDIAVAGIAATDIATFPTDDMQPDGLVVLDSPHGFDDTLDRLRAAIDAQDDTVWFGEVDFTARATAVGVDLVPTHLLLFGGPGPGGRAMAKAPTLGLDAFCQKLLVVEAEDGQVQVLFNDLLALADRQGVPKNLALRVINRRLVKTFTQALDD
jgi:uncharacterized protein (DUF302 family)